MKFEKILSPDSPQSVETSCSRTSQSSTSQKDRITTTATTGSDRSSDKFSWLSHYSVEPNTAVVSSNMSSPSLTSGLQCTKSNFYRYRIYDGLPYFGYLYFKKLDIMDNFKFSNFFRHFFKTNFIYGERWTASNCYEI